MKCPNCGQEIDDKIILSRAGHLHGSKALANDPVARKIRSVKALKVRWDAYREKRYQESLKG